jgi:[acyl-carrier-protein] S-malonyltransferase
LGTIGERVMALTPRVDKLEDMARPLPQTGTVLVSVEDVDAREAQFRACTPGSALPLVGTPQWRQLRGWLMQLIVTERVLRSEASRLGVTVDNAPTLPEVLPDGTARFEVGSLAASALADPLARAVFWYVTEDVDVSEMEVAAFHERNPRRFSSTVACLGAGSPSLDAVRPAIAAHLRGTARRRAFRQWLETRTADLIHSDTLSGPSSHSADPRRPRRR